MKKLILPILLLISTGCDFDVPLSHIATKAADPNLTGTWLGQSSDGKPIALDIQATGTDYIVTYQEDGDSLTFKGFEINADGLNLIQLELQNADSKKYLFIKYELSAKELSVYRLNTAVVSAKCQTSDELLNDIRIHLQNSFLFQNPMIFIRNETPQRN